MLNIVHNRILNTARLPLKRINGSFNERTQIGEQMFQKFYDTFMPQTQKDSCPKKVFYESLKAMLKPNKINCSVYKLEDLGLNRDGCLGDDVNIIQSANRINIRYNGYFFELPTDEQNKNFLHKYTILHEVRHLVDKLVHPKIMLRSYGIAMGRKNKLALKRLESIYLEDITSKLHSNLFHIEYLTDKILQKVDNNTAINILQYLRYSIMTEIFAYKEEIKCLQKNNEIDQAMNLMDFINNDFIFEKKLTLINKKLRNLICLERKMHKIKLNKISKDNNSDVQSS